MVVVVLVVFPCIFSVYMHGSMYYRVHDFITQMRSEVTYYYYMVVASVSRSCTEKKVLLPYAAVRGGQAECEAFEAFLAFPASVEHRKRTTHALCCHTTPTSYLHTLYYCTVHSLAIFYSLHSPSLLTVPAFSLINGIERMIVVSTPSWTVCLDSEPQPKDCNLPK